MFGLSHLFYPWGFILQILAIVHFVRRRPENYWFFVIFFGGFLGAGVYIVAEVLPVSACFAEYFKGLAGDRAFKSSKRKSWTILPLQTTKSSASYIKIKSNLPKRAKRSRTRSRRAAIPCTPFTIARRLL